MTYSLEQISSVHFPSYGNIEKQLFLPVLSRSTSIRCMTGYFSSGVFIELAQAVSLYLNQPDSQPMKFVISPHLEEKDRRALEIAYNKGSNFFHILFPEQNIEANTLRNYSVAALSYLVSQKKIEIRVALKEGGLFHSKVWLFDTDKGLCAIHGSSNATLGGLSNNYEQLTLNRFWLGQESKETCLAFEKEFEEIWNNNRKGINTLKINNKTLRAMKSASQVEYIDQSISSLKFLLENGENSIGEEYGRYIDNYEPRLSIPNYLDYRSKEYEHQGEAVDAWFKNNKQGILSIATGGGKTITSLIAATKLMEEVGNLLIVIAVPTKTLMTQWEEEIKEFGVVPINTLGMSSQSISKKITDSIRLVRRKNSRVEILLVTIEALSSGKYFSGRQDVSRVESFLIVDELHNLGSKRSQVNFPIGFKYRLGLSATYERQFDEEGTKFLLETFGKVVYEFGLKEAIGKCLVNYNYFAHFVILDDEEEYKFIELTNKIKKLSFAANDPTNIEAKEQWSNLCIRRRRLIEVANNKVNAFKSVLPSTKQSIKRTLVFCTDKDPKQLLEVNSHLSSLGVLFHQVTADETSDKNLMQNIIEDFSNDKLQVLTSKRVLDEGFNAPQTEVAYLLASNTSIRQWTQRLGRVLRLSPSTNKKIATIYDFIVMPTVDGKIDNDLSSLLKSEHNRIQFFSENSNNYLMKNGGYEASKKIMKALGDEF